MTIEPIPRDESLETHGNSKGMSPFVPTHTPDNSWLEAGAEGRAEAAATGLSALEIARGVLSGTETAQNTNPAGAGTVATEQVVEKVEAAAERKRDQHAFGGYLKLWQYDPEGRYDLEAVTQQDSEWLTPEKIGAFLFGTRTELKELKRQDGVMYQLPVNERLAGHVIALNPAEYSIVVQYPERFADRVRAKTQAVNELTDEAQAKRERSVGHALDGKLETMQDHVAKLIEAHRDIRELNAYAHRPGRASKREMEVRRLLSVAWNEFTTMLDVVHTARGWDDEKRTQAEATLLKSLTQGPQNQRVNQWWQMLDIADNYLQQRISLFKNRIQASSEIVSKLPVAE